MKKTLALLLALCMVFALCACGSTPAPAATPTPAPTAEPAAETPAAEETAALPTIDALELMTGAATGSWYTIGAGIADKFNDFYEGFPMTAVPGSGSIGNVGVIAAGDSEIGMSYGPFLVAAMNGNAPYETAYTNIRSICVLQPTVVQPLTDLDISSAIEFFNGSVPGKLGCAPQGNASTYIISLIINEYGLDMDALDVYYADTGSLNDAWADRMLNLYMPMLNVPASTVTEVLASRNESRLLSLDEDVINTLIEKYGFAAYDIPAGTYDRQDEVIHTVGLPIVFFCTDDADEELIYNFTKSIYENKDYFLGVHSSFNEFEPEAMGVGTAIELHPGAARFYEEVGLLK